MEEFKRWVKSMNIGVIGKSLIGQISKIWIGFRSLERGTPEEKNHMHMMKMRLVRVWPSPELILLTSQPVTWEVRVVGAGIVTLLGKPVDQEDGLVSPKTHHANV